MQKKYVSYRCHKIKDVKRITKGCRSVAQFIEMVEDNYAVVQLGESSSVYSAVLRYWLSMILIYSTLNKDLMKSGCSVCVHPRSSAVVDILPPQADNDIKVMTEKPSVTYQDIGGLDVQKQELRTKIRSLELYKLNEISTAIGTLYDKRALAQGQSTENTTIEIKMPQDVMKYAE